MNAASSIEESKAAALPFLRAQGFSVVTEFSILRGGANNRVFRVAGPGKQCVLKEYFRNSADPRDRFAAEKAFYDYIAASRTGHTPKPVAWDEQRRLGLLEFIEGRKLLPEETDAEAVGTAFDFVLELNRSSRVEPSAERIPAASEACFSLGEHLTCIQQRIERLRQISGESALDRAAQVFVAEELAPRWANVREEIERTAGPEGDKPLSTEQRCLSPSDFGFHNALLGQQTGRASDATERSRGALKFFDFEYAGWDDPAKLVCDFFCQPELPVDIQHRELALKRMGGLPALPPNFSERCSLLLPAYRLKWCCILLNDFVRRDLARREFSLGDESVEARKERQLRKAKRAVAAWPR